MDLKVRRPEVQGQFSSPSGALPYETPTTPGNFPRLIQQNRISSIDDSEASDTSNSDTSKSISPTSSKSSRTDASGIFQVPFVQSKNDPFASFRHIFPPPLLLPFNSRQLLAPDLDIDSDLLCKRCIRCNQGMLLSSSPGSMETQNT